MAKKRSRKLETATRRKSPEPAANARAAVEEKAQKRCKECGYATWRAPCERCGGGPVE